MTLITPENKKIENGDVAKYVTSPFSLSVGIITAPRDSTSYIAESIESYFASGIMPRPYVSCEPGSGRFCLMSKCDIHEHVEKLGAMLNWKCTAEYLLKMNTTHIMIVEDDVEWLPGSHQLLFNGIKQFPDKVISLYVSVVNARKNQMGWHKPYLHKTMSWCGNLTMCFPRQLLLHLLYETEFKNETRDCFLDSTIGACIGEHLMVYQPAQVHHLGEVSTFIGKDSHKKYSLTRRAYDSDYITSRQNDF